MIQLYALDSGVPIEWLGPIWAVANLFVAAGAYASTRLTTALRTHPDAFDLHRVDRRGLCGPQVVDRDRWIRLLLLPHIHARPLVPRTPPREQRLIPTSDRAALLSLGLWIRLAFAVLAPLVGSAVDRSGQGGPARHRRFVTIACLLALAWLVASRRSDEREFEAAAD
ncbi:MAG: hypothetical protein R3F21_13860 [Myxococcota bacterium]